VGDNEVAHGCKIIQVEIALPSRVQFCLGLAQFFILHRQLDLMHAKLMDQLQRFRARQGRQILWRRRALLPGDLFGPPAQFGDSLGLVIIAVHRAPLSSLRHGELKDRFSPGALPSSMTVMSLPVTNARSWKSLDLLGGAAALCRREVRGVCGPAPGRQMEPRGGFTSPKIFSQLYPPQLAIDKWCDSARLSEMGVTGVMGVTDEED